MVDENTPNDADSEWERRILCSDESCIGTIGPDGRCKECGRPYEGTLPAESESAGSDGAGENPENRSTDDDTRAAPVQAPQADDGQAETTEDEWARRTLCADESCIGIIGPDGRCKECGKPYAGE